VNTAFRESFDADLSAIRNAGLLLRIKQVIERVEAARPGLSSRFPTSNVEGRQRRRGGGRGTLRKEPAAGQNKP
jgi:hypothetical protein